MSETRPGTVLKLRARLAGLLPGLLVVVLVAMAAQFISDHYGAPAILLALAFGMALNFLNDHGNKAAPGIAFAARDVLKFGVVLLGARIGFDMLGALGWPMFMLVILATILTISAGAFLSRVCGRGASFGILTGGAVAICGASAAVAISAVLPRTERSEQELLFAVLCVTLLSTLAMIFYPIATSSFGMSDTEAGAFLGATIHDVAQVVGAGFLISDEAGKTATLVKLTRVALLAPTVIVIALIMRRVASSAQGAAPRTPLLPVFVVAFLVLAGMNTLGFVPAAAQEAAIQVSRWALLAAIAAVGIKSSLRSVMALGPAAILLVAAESVLLAVFVFGGLHLIA